MGDSRFSPVVALDMDGVLRLMVRPGSTLPYETFDAQITFRQDAYPVHFHRPFDWDENGQSIEWETFSLIGAAWVRGLIERGIEVVWATTWQEHANTYFADVLGVPHLPSALTHHLPRFTEGSPSWKARNLIAAFPGRPVLWVDDNLPYFDRGYFAERRSPRDRAISEFHHITNSALGIQDQDIAWMNTWLRLASTPEGHDELRQRRQSLLARQRKNGLR